MRGLLATKLGVAARNGLGLETGLRYLEIMLLGIISCGGDPAKSKAYSGTVQYVSTARVP
jgi:hypothetical protein